MTSIGTGELSYERLHRGFTWNVPEKFNIGIACADRQPPGALALVEVTPDGSQREYTFGQITALSNRLANGLRSLGVQAGDRVGILLPQRVETAVAHLAIYKLGAIAVPMSVLFGPQAIRYRVGDCQMRALIAEAGTLELLAEVDELDELEVVVAGEGTVAGNSFERLIGDGDARFEPAGTYADTPALLIYTSGTTGAPKGALHAHRVLLGHLPGFELSHEFFPQPGDRFWTPADWAWIGGLMDALMPAWYHGRPVVAARRERFDPEWAVALMAQAGIRNVFLPPTALKLMREAGIRGQAARLRTAMSGGEPLGEEMLAWARETLGVVVNEIYGQTEVNYVVGNCAAAWEVRPGSMGRPYPGHRVAVLDDQLERCPPGELGQIAVAMPDPVAFIGYWNRPQATDEKFTPDGEWLLTGDLAKVDENGYFTFCSRADDVISSSGYRIGPAEIEECLIGHPAVAMAAAVGVPDRLRGQVVKAFVKLVEGHSPSEWLDDELRQLVRARLAAYEYPRAIEYVDELPLTTTGKIRRTELRAADGGGP